jgi:Uma2 family endonuclease
MGVLAAPDLWSGQERALTVEDMENMPDDEFRYELEHRVPDVAVVRAESLDSFFQEAPPVLVVEVASLGTRLYDRNRKEDIYEGFAIPGYWIIEPDRDCPELTVLELRSGVYEQTALVTGDEKYRAAAPFPVTIAPSELITVS